MWVPFKAGSGAGSTGYGVAIGFNEDGLPSDLDAADGLLHVLTILPISPSIKKAL